MKSKTRSSSLNLAAKQGHLDIVHLLAENPRTNLLLVNSNGDDCLMLAIKNGHLDVVYYLINRITNKKKIAYRDEDEIISLDIGTNNNHDNYSSDKEYVFSLQSLFLVRYATSNKLMPP